MKNITEHTGKLEVIDRLPSSRNGNPRYLLRIAGVTCCTMPDSTQGYIITQYDGQDIAATIGMHYGRSTLATIHRGDETMNAPTFLTIEYKGFYILTASDRTEVKIAAEGYGVIGQAKTITGAKRTITRIIKSLHEIGDTTE